jgi:hypothetical protein
VDFGEALVVITEVEQKAHYLAMDRERPVLAGHLAKDLVFRPFRNVFDLI